MVEPLDLDALRVARAEQNGVHPTLKFGGRTLDLPSELPWDVAVTMAQGDLEGALKELLSEKDYAHLMKTRPTVPEMTAIAEYLEASYGKTAGESSASETS